MSDIPKTVQALIERIHELESENLNMAERISALKKLKVELEETNRNNVANYQLQVAELSAAIKVKDEALKWFIKDGCGHIESEWKHKIGCCRICGARSAISITPCDALKEYLKETVELLERFHNWFIDDRKEGEFKELISKELSRLERGDKC